MGRSDELRAIAVAGCEMKDGGRAAQGERRPPRA